MNVSANPYGRLHKLLTRRASAMAAIDECPAGSTRRATCERRFKEADAAVEAEEERLATEIGKRVAEELQEGRARLNALLAEAGRLDSEAS